MIGAKIKKESRRSGVRAGQKGLRNKAETVLFPADLGSTALCFAVRVHNVSLTEFFPCGTGRTLP
jgi:hypothetical protein